MKNVLYTCLILAGVAAMAFALPAQAQQVSDDIAVGITIEGEPPVPTFLIGHDLAMKVTNGSTVRAAYAETGACLHQSGYIYPTFDMDISSRNAAGADNRFFMYSETADAYLSYTMQFAFRRLSGWDGGILPDGNVTGYELSYSTLTRKTCDDPSNDGNIVIRASVYSTPLATYDFSSAYGVNYHDGTEAFLSGASAGQSYDFSDVITVTLTPAI